MDFDKELMVIFDQYASEVIDEKMRANWTLISYDGIGMQDRLSPIVQFGKVCMIAFVIPMMVKTFN